METKHYINTVIEALNLLEETQSESLEKASNAMVHSFVNGGRVFAFGSGHSHMIAEEFYARAGGLASIIAILPEELMLHGPVGHSTNIERLSGYARPVLEYYRPTSNDTLIVISNSGRNNVPVEMCLVAKEHGMNVIAITSMKHSSQSTSRHESGLRMFEIADVTIDNGAVAGDAGYYVSGVSTPTGPTSNIIGLTIAQILVVNTVKGLVEHGIEPPLFKSSNLDGSDAFNDILFDTYLR